MKKLFIPIILGTGREERRSEKVAQFILARAKEHGGFETELIDVRDYVKSTRTIPAWVESDVAKPWRDLATRADGYIIVLPEYNHGYPGELKLLLDMALRQYRKKPVGLCAVSSGMFGGARAVENFWQVTLELGMVPVMNPLYFGKVKELFDEKGEITNEIYKEKVPKFFNEMCWFGHALKSARDKGEKAYSCEE